jgi:aldehyde:ferredoxin oxidoreductase
MDLDCQEAVTTHEEEQVYRRFLGGRGVNSWHLLERQVPGADPLGPENLLCFSCGLLTGTEAPSSARLHVSARSPLTGLLGSSNVGGGFGARLRLAGVQSLVVRGQAPRPSLLLVEDGRVEVLDASDWWGQDTRAVASGLVSRFGPGSEVLVIGVGGENLVPFACMVTGTQHAAGRTGMGAVMGSKRLKAIVVRAKRERTTHPGSQESIREYVSAIRSSPRYEMYSRYSNSAFVNWANDMGILGTRNYQGVRFEGAGQIDGSRLIDYVTRRHTCHRCPVGCKASFEIRQGPYAGTRGERPDIEPIMNLGAKCGLDDPEALLHLHALAGTLGIDVISAGGVLAFAMETYERGIITRDDTGGIELTWGNASAMAAMMDLMARREGFGAVLSHGVRGAAQLVGRGSEAYAHHSKGLELTGYDPRGALGTALGYAVSTRGGDFTSVYPTPEYRWKPEQGKEAFGTECSVDRLSHEGKGDLVKRTMTVCAVLDGLGICKVPALSLIGDFDLDKEARLASAVTGWHFTAGDLFTAGERIINSERLFNLVHGAHGTEDTLPEHFQAVPVPDPGPTQGTTVRVRALVDDFYRAMGWDHDGTPPRATMEALGLEGLWDRKLSSRPGVQAPSALPESPR